MGDDREAIVIEVLARADPGLLAGRPALIAGKLARMARDLYAFYRGIVPLWLRDASAGTLDGWASEFAVERPAVLCIGDPHPENFGLLCGADGTLALEPNDFDAAERYPYLWCLRRLCGGLVLACRYAGGEAAASEYDVAREAARAYADEMLRRAHGADTLGRVLPPFEETILEDLHCRAQKAIDDGEETARYLDPGRPTKRLRRGSFQADQPEKVLRELPDFARAALPAALDEWRRSLIDPPPRAFCEILDCARLLGKGVASWPNLRVLILVRGRETPVLLELKELREPGVKGFTGLEPHWPNARRRVAETTRALWARPDAEPCWGVASWLGASVQIRRESRAHRQVRMGRLTGARATPEALVDLAHVLGRVLARMHATEHAGLRPAPVIAHAIGERADAFATEQAEFSEGLVEQLERDWQSFRQALRQRGPLLGQGGWAELIGEPAPIEPWR